MYIKACAHYHPSNSLDTTMTRVCAQVRGSAVAALPAARPIILYDLSASRGVEAILCMHMCN